jgi:hypothetical protein
MDVRELVTVAIGLARVIGMARRSGVRKVHCALIAAGPSRSWHPIHSLIAMIRGIRASQRAIKSALSRFPDIDIWIVDKVVWSTILGNRLPLQEELVADEVRIYVKASKVGLDVAFADRTLLLVEPKTNLTDIAKRLGIPFTDNTILKLIPETVQGQQLTMGTAGKYTIRSLGIMTGSTVEYCM